MNKTGRTPLRTWGCVIAAAFAAASGNGLNAAECEIDSTDIDRGQHKPFYICSKDITPDYELHGLDEANISVYYDQHIRRCTMFDQRDGIFLWLDGEADAQSATLEVKNASGEALCDPITLTVPERTPLGPATLTASRSAKSAIHLLEIEAAEGQDLSGTCAGGIEFPDWGRQPSRWPKLRIISAAEMGDVPRDLRKQKQTLSCSKQSIRALVAVDGAQLEPAKIVVADVVLADGSAVDGVAYAALPEPAWVSAMPDDEAKFIEANGLRTRYWEKGKGPALVLLHGGQPTGKAGGALTWIRVFDGLAENFRVFAIDRVGQGLTDNLPNEDDYKRYYEHVIDHVWGFVNAVGLERVGLVGHSQGGWPVGRLALDHPDRVFCAVSVDSVLAPGREESLHTARYYMNTIQFHPPEGETLESIRRTREFQSYTLNNLGDPQRGYDLTQLPKLEEASVIMEKLQMNPRHPDAQALFARARAEIAAGKLRVPSLVIWGYNDPSSPFSAGMKFFDVVNAATPVSEMHIFNRSGHSSHIEHPEEYTRVVTSFCGRY